MSAGASYYSKRTANKKPAESGGFDFSESTEMPLFGGGTRRSRFFAGVKTFIVLKSRRCGLSEQGAEKRNQRDVGTKDEDGNFHNGDSSTAVRWS